MSSDGTRAAVDFFGRGAILAVFTGAVGVRIGFGLQAIFNNFVAGLILLSEKSLKVGDFVDLEKDHLAGTVRQISIRNTIITTPDSIDVAVPNSEFVNGRVTNWTMLDAYARIPVTASSRERYLVSS